MQFKLKNYSLHSPIVVVRSENYASIIEHTHDFIEIVYVKSGEALHVINDQVYHIGVGDIMVIPKEYRHYIKPINSHKSSENDFRIINIIFEEGIVEFDKSSFSGKPINVGNDGKILHLIEQICEEYRAKEDNYIYAMKMYLSLMLLLLERKDRLLQKGKSLISGVDFTDIYIDKVVQYVSENYKQNIFIDDIANYIGLSKGYLQRLFKKRAGLTLVDYIIRYRIQESCKLLLETNYSIYEIAGQVGFFDLKHFYNKFKELLNQTPKQYRKQNCEINIKNGSQGGNNGI